MESQIKLSESWKSRLLSEFQQPYMQQLREFLRKEYSQNKVIYPRGSEYFAALDATKFEDVKVVILGQDPYHGPGQAHGLCFSVQKGVPPPPSLVNIFQEISTDLGIQQPKGFGSLDNWAQQGVLLLNAVLTVQQSSPGSHQNKGWEQFTDKIIEMLAARQDPLVFMLWGSYAQKKGQFIDSSRHLVLKAPHPSPLSAYRGFMGCRHFSKANDFLQKMGKKPIDWQIRAGASVDK